MTMWRVFPGFLWGLCLALHSGCAIRSTAPPQLLVLTALVAPAVVNDTSPGVVVGPISLPAYADRAQFLILKGDSEMVGAENARWVEPLAQNFSRVLVEDLSRRLATGRITSLGAAAAADSLQIALEVTDFVTTQTGEARLTVYWRILSVDGRQVLASHKSSYSESVAGNDYPAWAAAMSRMLAALSADLASAIRQAATRP